jgi:hypothetical protein
LVKAPDELQTTVGPPRALTITYTAR